MVENAQAVACAVLSALELRAVKNPLRTADTTAEARNF